MLADKPGLGLFWYGVVEGRNDPLQMGRVRVRIFGYHSPLEMDIPSEDLPWAVVAMPTTSACTSGVGSTNGLVPGGWVLGIWKDDGQGFQIPLIIASVPGIIPESKEYEDSSSGIDLMQQDMKKSVHIEKYGDGFRDMRTEEELEKEPTNNFEKKEYPDGKNKEGDLHGAQLKNDKAEKFPRAKSYGYVDYADGQQTDVSVISINDKKQIDKTMVGFKRTLREDGGVLEQNVKIANIDLKKFKCGVTNESGINKGTNKKLGIGNNALDSSWVPSTFENYKSVLSKPTNSDGEPVYKKD